MSLNEFISKIIDETKAFIPPDDPELEDYVVVILGGKAFHVRNVEMDTDGTLLIRL